MTERGLPIVDGAPACPFVAFEDDRDERAASPDHRHRCYAEGRPAPRALAHQEAYCLSSAFPVCPTFQDWARREAARSRAEPRPSDLGAADAAAAAALAQRNPPRNWSAPPPWQARGGRAGDRGDAAWEADPDEAPSDEEIRDATPPRGRGLSGSYADRAASDPLEAGPGSTDEDGLGVTPAAGPLAAGPLAAAGLAARAPGPRQAPSDEAPELWNDEPAGGSAGGPPQRPRRERDPGRVAAFSGEGGDAHGSAPPRRPERRREEPAPEWERAKPLEAYPTLRARRLPELSLPPIIVAVVALALAAAVLFALPGLLGFGNPPSAASPGASTPIRTALPSVAPTSLPQPTPQLYVVQAGDTLSRIAGRFGISLAELIAANAETLPNPDLLQIGDQLIIPAPVPSELPAASG